ncbi:MAG TPA: AbrB/MazE/SpoVT family DNA-binding domain-containing protein [Terracidiphilus sp.]|jgi:AbrB family looped-hinge helix DNA binding protein
MPPATMTSKGQITIPVKIRKALGLKPGVRINFYEVEDGQYVLRPKAGSIMDMRGCLAGNEPPVTIEEMNQVVRDQAAELDKATMSSARKNQPRNRPTKNQPNGEAA